MGVLSQDFPRLVSGGGIPEAPEDGRIYGRQDATWVEVSGAGGGVPEAPTDGQAYVRQSEGWSVLSHIPTCVQWAPGEDIHDTYFVQESGNGITISNSTYVSEQDPRAKQIYFNGQGGSTAGVANIGEICADNPKEYFFVKLVYRSSLGSKQLTISLAVAGQRVGFISWDPHQNGAISLNGVVSIGTSIPNTVLLIEIDADESKIIVKKEGDLSFEASFLAPGFSQTLSTFEHSSFGQGQHNYLISSSDFDTGITVDSGFTNVTRLANLVPGYARTGDTLQVVQAGTYNNIDYEEGDGAYVANFTTGVVIPIRQSGGGGSPALETWDIQDSQGEVVSYDFFLNAPQEQYDIIGFEKALIGIDQQTAYHEITADNTLSDTAAFHTMEEDLDLTSGDLFFTITIPEGNDGGDSLTLYGASVIFRVFTGVPEVSAQLSFIQSGAGTLSLVIANEGGVLFTDNDFRTTLGTSALQMVAQSRSGNLALFFANGAGNWQEVVLSSSVPATNISFLSQLLEDGVNTVNAGQTISIQHNLNYSPAPTIPGQAYRPLVAGFTEQLTLPEDNVRGSMYEVTEAATFNGVRFVEGDVVLVTEQDTAIVNLTKNTGSSSINVWATLSSADKGPQIVLTQGNLRATTTAEALVGATITDMVGNFMFEISGAPNALGFGIIESAADLTTATNLTNSKFAVGLFVTGFSLGQTGTGSGAASPFSFTNFPSSFTSTDVFGLAFNSSTREVQFYFNGTRLTTSPSTITPVVSSSGYKFFMYLIANGNTAKANFGQTPFSYPISGFEGLSNVEAEFYGPLTVVSLFWNPNTGYPSTIGVQPGDLYYANQSGTISGKDYISGSGVWWTGSGWKDLSAGTGGSGLGSMVYLGELGATSGTGPTYVENGVYKITGDKLFWKPAGYVTADMKRWAPINSTIIGRDDAWESFTVDNSFYDNGYNFTGQIDDLPTEVNYSGPHLEIEYSSDRVIEFIVRNTPSTSDPESRIGVYQAFKPNDKSEVYVPYEGDGRILGNVYLDITTNKIIKVDNDVLEEVATLSDPLVGGDYFTISFSGAVAYFYLNGKFIASTNIPAYYEYVPYGYYKNGSNAYSLNFSFYYNTGRYPFKWVPNGTTDPKSLISYCITNPVASPLKIIPTSLSPAPLMPNLSYVSGYYDAYFGETVLNEIFGDGSLAYGTATFSAPNDTFENTMFPTEFEGIKLIPSIINIDEVVVPPCVYSLTADSSEVLSAGYSGVMSTDGEYNQRAIHTIQSGDNNVAAFQPGYLSAPVIPFASRTDDSTYMAVQIIPYYGSSPGALNQGFLPSLDTGSYEVWVRFRNAAEDQGFDIRFYRSAMDSSVSVQLRSFSGSILFNNNFYSLNEVTLAIGKDNNIAKLLVNSQDYSGNIDVSANGLLVDVVPIISVQYSSGTTTSGGYTTMGIELITDQTKFVEYNSSSYPTYNSIVTLGSCDACQHPVGYKEYNPAFTEVGTGLVFAPGLNTSEMVNYYTERMRFLNNHNVVSAYAAPIDANGANGDYFVDNLVGSVYGPKTYGTWKRQLQISSLLQVGGQEVYSDDNRAVTHTWIYGPWSAYLTPKLPFVSGKRTVAFQFDDYDGPTDSGYNIYQIEVLRANATNNSFTDNFTGFRRLGDRIEIYVDNVLVDTIAEPYADGEQVLLSIDLGPSLEMIITAPSGATSTQNTTRSDMAGYTWIMRTVVMAGYAGNQQGTFSILAGEDTSLTIPTDYEARWESGDIIPLDYDTNNLWAYSFPTVEFAVNLPGHLQSRASDGLWDTLVPFYGFDRAFYPSYNLLNTQARVLDDSGGVVSGVYTLEQEGVLPFFRSILETDNSGPFNSQIKMQYSAKYEGVLASSAKPYSKEDVPNLPEIELGNGYWITSPGSFSGVKYSYGDLLITDGNQDPSGIGWRIPGKPDGVYRDQAFAASFATEGLIEYHPAKSTYIFQSYPSVTVTSGSQYRINNTGTLTDVGIVLRFVQTSDTYQIIISTGPYVFFTGSEVRQTYRKGDVLELVKIRIGDYDETWVVTYYPEPDTTGKTASTTTLSSYEDFGCADLTRTKFLSTTSGTGTQSVTTQGVAFTHSAAGVGVTEINQFIQDALNPAYTEKLWVSAEFTGSVGNAGADYDSDFSFEVRSSTGTLIAGVQYNAGVGRRAAYIQTGGATEEAGIMPSKVGLYFERVSTTAYNVSFYKDIGSGWELWTTRNTWDVSTGSPTGFYIKIGASFTGPASNGTSSMLVRNVKMFRELRQGLPEEILFR